MQTAFPLILASRGAGVQKLKECACIEQIRAGDAPCRRAVPRGTSPQPLRREAIKKSSKQQSIPAFAERFVRWYLFGSHPRRPLQGAFADMDAISKDR